MMQKAFVLLIPSAYTTGWCGMTPRLTSEEPMHPAEGWTDPQTVKSTVYPDIILQMRQLWEIVRNSSNWGSESSKNLLWWQRKGVLTPDWANGGTLPGAYIHGELLGNSQFSQSISCFMSVYNILRSYPSPLECLLLSHSWWNLSSTQVTS